MVKTNYLLEETGSAIVRLLYMNAITASNDKRVEHPPRVPRYVTLPSRADGVSRALKKTFGQLDDMPSDLGDLVERLKRIDT